MVKAKNKEDIIEYSFQIGVSRTADKYSISEKEVWDIRKEFEDEMYENTCPCKESMKRGIASMCFVCTPEKRVKIPGQK